MTFDLHRYLARLRLDAPPPSTRCLADLQTAQMRAIPLATIEPFLGRAPALGPDRVSARLVEAGRGGWCFVQNQLLGLALGALGYPVRQMLGRVRMGAPAGGPRAHLALAVAAGGRDWLVDAGFGGPGPEVPPPLDAAGPVATPRGQFRLRTDGPGTVLECATPGGWFALYGVDAVPVTPADLEAATVVCTFWEKSPFPAHLMLNLLTAGGRISLFDLRLGGDREGTIGSRAEFAQVLADDFGLTLGTGDLDRIWTRLADTAARAAELRRTWRLFRGHRCR